MKCQKLVIVIVLHGKMEVFGAFPVLPPVPGEIYGIATFYQCYSNSRASQ